MVPDDTIPQNTEGNEFMTLAITPKSTSNVLVIEMVSMTAGSVSSAHIAALFQDTTANALSAVEHYQVTAAGCVTLKLVHTMLAGTTSSTTFKIRIGLSNAGTITFNGSGGTRRYSTTPKSYILITEYKA